MRLVLALVLPAILSGCSSTPRVASEPRLLQEHSVECVASNFEDSGCRTEHEFALVTTLSSEGVPSVNDLRDQDAGASQY